LSNLKLIDEKAAKKTEAKKWWHQD
jgi:hypothetical protein